MSSSLARQLAALRTPGTTALENASYYRQGCNNGLLFKIINDFEQFFTIFTMLTLIFWKDNKSLEHLNVLLFIFFVSGVFF